MGAVALSDLLQLMEVLAFIYLTLWAGFVLLRLVAGAMRSAYVVYVVFYVLNGLPLLFDALLGRPYYSIFPGIERASNDPATRWVYVAFMVLVPPILLLMSARKTLPDGNLSRLSLLMHGRVVTSLVWIVAMMPFVVWAVSPAPGAYTQYGTIYVRHRLLSGDVTDQQFNQFHILISSTALLSIASVAFLIYRHPSRLTFQCMLPYVGILLGDIWLNGKRNSVAFVVFMVVAAVWSRGTVRGPVLLLVGGSAVSILLLFSWWYQEDFRAVSTQGSALQYEGNRIDYGRDHSVRLSIYSMLYGGDERILDYPGQSFVIYATIAVPRSVWEGKPPNYADMHTSAALMARDPQRAWSLTTSWLDEMIANFGVLGMVLGPASLGILCRVGDSQGPGILQLLTMFFGSLLLAVHLAAIAPVVLLWLAALLFSIVRLRWRPSRSMEVRRPSRQSAVLRVG